ncbi:transcriptional regulator, partial [Mesorhizobium sp. M7A.T.Ca.TU.009.01.3.2]
DDDRLARIADELAAGGEAELERMKAALRAEHIV